MDTTLMELQVTERIEVWQPELYSQRRWHDLERHGSNTDLHVARAAGGV